MRPEEIEAGGEAGGGRGPWRPAEERPEKRAAEDGTERAPEEQTTASSDAEIREPDGRDVNLRALVLSENEELGEEEEAEPF